MARKCCVESCESSQAKSKNVSFHVFPTDRAMCMAWKKAIKVNTGRDIAGPKQVICSAHFLDWEVRKLGANTSLNKLAIPSIFPPSECTNEQVLCQESKENNDSIEKQPKLNSKPESSNDSTPAPAFEPKADLVISSVFNTESLIIYNNDIGTNGTHHSNDRLDCNSCASLSSVIAFDRVQQSWKKDHASVSLPSVSHSIPSRTIRYPGDINEDEEVCSDAVKNNIRLCKTKIKEQAKQIHTLKQVVRRQKKKIDKFKELLKKSKIKIDTVNPSN